MLRTYGIHPDDFNFVEKNIDGIPEVVQTRLLKSYSQIKGKHEGETRRNRNLFLLEKKDEIQSVKNVYRAQQKLRDPRAQHKLYVALQSLDIESIKNLDKWISDESIQKALDAQGMDEDKIIEKAKKIHESSAMNEGGETELMIRKNLRKKVKQAVARINFALGLVGGKGNGNDKYCTEFELDLRNQQKGRWQGFGQAFEMKNGGRTLRLIDLMNKTAKCRFSETYVMTKGMEQVAAEKGKTWAMITLTAPPQFHINPTGKNSTAHWNGETPDQAHQWIKEDFTLARKKWEKTGVKLVGLRVVEPHKDGTPHWHIMAFATQKELDIIEKKLRETNDTWEDERGCKFRRYDPNYVGKNGKRAASAASYLCKYLLKTINSIEKLEGEMGLVDSWRSTWAIRAFSFAGLPSAKVWRELRALPGEPQDALLNKAWKCATENRAADFIKLMGGLGKPRKEHRIKVTKETSMTKIETRFETIDGGIERSKREKWTKERNEVQEGEFEHKINEVEVIHSCPRAPAAPSEKQKEKKATKQRAANGETDVGTKSECIT